MSEIYCDVTKFGLNRSAKNEMLKYQRKFARSFHVHTCDVKNNRTEIVALDARSSYFRLIQTQHKSHSPF